QYWERVRAHLATSALFSQSHIGEPFGVHETHLVYRKRNEWELDSIERWFLARTYFGSSAGVVPGWFWLADYGPDLDDILFSLVEDDPDINLRKGILRTLIRSHICLPLTILRHLIENENDIDILTQAIRSL